jgi:hypothetical protein
VTTAFHPSIHAVHTSQVDRGDPFNVSGFFSASDGRDGDWTWLREVEEEEEVPLSSTRTIFPSTLDEKAEHEDSQTKVSNVIQCEDKLGVLSLRTLLCSAHGTLCSLCSDMSHVLTKTFAHASYSDADTSLMSPYIVDEAFDHDALHRLYSIRRVVSKTSGVSLPDASASVLFASGKDDTELIQTSLPVWMSGVGWAL